MNIKTDINERYTQTELHVCKDRLDDEVRSILAQLHAIYGTSLTGIDEVGNRCVLSLGNVITFYAEKQKVFAVDPKKKYAVSRTLQELENEFKECGFVRISKSEIVNFHKIQSLDMSITGTIRVIMKNGYETYTSRRNVTRLKEMLKAQEAKVQETKAREAKVQESKVQEAKPQEAKVQETKPQEAKAQETKAREAKKDEI